MLRIKGKLFTHPAQLDHLSTTPASSHLTLTHTSYTQVVYRNDMLLLTHAGGTIATDILEPTLHSVSNALLYVSFDPAISLLSFYPQETISDT